MSDKRSYRESASATRQAVADIERDYGPAAPAVLLATGLKTPGCQGISSHANGGGDGGGVSMVYAYRSATVSARRSAA